MTIHYSVTGIDDDGSKSFHREYKRALENDSVVLYNGHSGLGSNMNLDDIRSQDGTDIHLPKRRYQILLLDGCSTYSHYVDHYFKQKQTRSDPHGSKNLDVITNGIEGSFGNFSQDSMALVGAVLHWATTGAPRNYGQILSKFSPSSLPGVSGEEDNPTR